MAAVTQTIPTYVGGVSQQPDYIKPPGYLNECQNGYPDVIFGMQKRPGAKLETILLDSSSEVVKASDVKDAYWFSIARDGDFPYFGCVVPATDDDKGQIRIWNSATRVECTVTYADSSNSGSTQDYLDSKKGTDYKVVTIDKSSALVNRSKVVTASATLTGGTLTGKVSNFSKLPDSPSDGDIYRIVNSEATEKDDYYVKWDNDAWVETIKPGISDGFNNWTAPHGLIKTGLNEFTFGEANYVSRTVGDDNTNQQPSFVGQTIQEVFFYFNRVGFLSQDNVIMSASLTPDYGTTPQEVNFYAKSAQVAIASDPIDLNAASVRAIKLYSVQASRSGLILFANGEQFFLFSDQGFLTPLTAEIKSVSTYEMDKNVQAIEMGDEFYFISKTPRYTRCFRMQVRGEDDSPVVTEVSKIVQEYIPSGINNLVPNTQNQMIALANNRDTKMWLFKQFMNNGERTVESWFKWDFPGKILSCSFITDKMYSLIELENDSIAIVQASLNKNPDEDMLTNVPADDSFVNPLEGIGPYLDLWNSDVGTVTYDRATNTSTIPLPTNYPALSNEKACVILSYDSNLRTLSNPSTEAGVFFDAKVNGNNFEVIGDLTKVEDKIVVGYKFDMIYALPTTYFRGQDGTADNTASLMLSRYKFMFASSGVVDFKISGYTNYEAPYSVLNPQFYPANTLPIYDEVIFDVPLHLRNEFFNFTIFSDSPYPCSLMKLQWEGNYNPRYYKRS